MYACSRKEHEAPRDWIRNTARGFGTRFAARQGNDHSQTPVDGATGCDSNRPPIVRTCPNISPLPEQRNAHQPRLSENTHRYQRSVTAVLRFADACPAVPVPTGCRLKGKRPMQSGKIVVEHLYKVFGSNPQEAIGLLKEGWSKEKILAEKGAVIGVSDVSFSVEEGEIFVLMGLSGSGKSTLIRLINRLVEPSAGDVYIDGQNVAKLPQ